MCVGYDPNVVSVSLERSWRKTLESSGITLSPINQNLIDQVWGDLRPAGGLGNLAVWCGSRQQSCAVAAGGPQHEIRRGAPVPGASGGSTRSNPGAVARSCALRLTRAAASLIPTVRLRRPRESTWSPGRRRAAWCRRSGSAPRSTPAATAPAFPTVTSWRLRSPTEADSYQSSSIRPDTLKKASSRCGHMSKDDQRT